MKRYSALVYSCVIIVLALPVAGYAFTPPGDEVSLRAIPEKIADGWNRGDGDAVAAVYADDGVLVAGHGVVTKGRGEIARYHNRLFDNELEGTRLTVSVTGVRRLSSNVAVMQAEGGILWPGQTELAPGNRCIQSFVVVKKAGLWRVVLFQNTRIQVSE